MEEMQPITNPNVSIEIQGKSTRPWFKIIGFAVLGLVLGGSLVFAGVQIGRKQSQVTIYPSPTPLGEVSPTSIPIVTSIPTQIIVTPTPDPTAGWKTYILKTLNLEFKLPPIFNSFGEMTEQIIPGEKGTSLCMTFPRKTSFFIKPVIAGTAACVTNHFGIGTTSIDFEAGRMAGFTDLQGYVIENGKYYAKLLGKKFEIPPSLVEQIGGDGLSMLKITGRDTTEGEFQGPIAGTPGKGRVGALINTNNKTCPGLAVEMELTGSLTEYLFNQILSTFKFFGGEDCIKEGDELGISEALTKKGCCQGLVEIPCFKPYPNGECPTVGGDCSVCTKCGDKECSLGENKCNCSQDCK